MQAMVVDDKVPGLWVKNLFDGVLAGLLLVVLSPLFAVIVLLIRLDSRGPVFFRQPRVGKDGKLFKMIKFRTMVQNADKMGPGLTADNDPRITRVGRFLRRISLDELPQLFNVLRGEMSLVGPRPEIPEIVGTYRPWMRQALRIKPGMTGLSQVNGRDDLELVDKLNYEVKYVEEYSLLLDLRILLKTIPAVISGRGNRY